MYKQSRKFANYAGLTIPGSTWGVQSVICRITRQNRRWWGPATKWAIVHGVQSRGHFAHYSVCTEYVATNPMCQRQSAGCPPCVWEQAVRRVTRSALQIGLPVRGSPCEEEEAVKPGWNYHSNTG